MTSATSSSSKSPLSNHLLQRFDINGPRYTSYPTADRFVKTFTDKDLANALKQRQKTPESQNQPISIYIHIPFCESLCYYCACNKIITKHHDRADAYLDYLEKEIALIANLLRQEKDENKLTPVSQLHFGGGSPTFLNDEQLERVMNLLHQNFQFTPTIEASIEVDPRTINIQRLEHLRKLGLNRLSLGVQDFDLDVQKAVHRVQSTQQVFELTERARQIGFESINIDLIYGLPKQTPESFTKTLEHVCNLRPDRIALYAYAHLPERFKPQRRIADYEIPAAADKVAMFNLALKAFNEAGYLDIGMDHFALLEDSLSIAKKNGLLHRNFQGYSTQANNDLIGLGVSSISKIGTTYSQSFRDVESYYEALDQARLPVMQGLTLSQDDLIRRSVIMSIMCQGAVSFKEVEGAYQIDFKNYFASELETLHSYEESEIITFTPKGFEVTALGWKVIRAIAMVFDRYLQLDRNRTRFSKIL